MPSFFGFKAIYRLAVYNQGGGTAVALDGYFGLFAFVYAVTESIEVTVSCKTKHSAYWVGEVEYGIVGTEQLCSGCFMPSLDGEIYRIVITYLLAISNSS